MSTKLRVCCQFNRVLSLATGSERTFKVNRLVLIAAGAVLAVHVIFTVVMATRALWRNNVVGAYNM